MTKRVGEILVIESEPPEECAFCKQLSHVRPYGPNGERVCHPCAMKDEPAARRQMDRLLDGATGVVVNIDDLAADTGATLTINLPTVYCPQCGHRMNAAGGAGKPGPGSYSVCIACYALLVYTSTMGVRLVSDIEIATMPREQFTDIVKVRDGLKAFAAVHGPVRQTGH